MNTPRLKQINRFRRNSNKLNQAFKSPVRSSNSSPSSPAFSKLDPELSAKEIENLDAEIKSIEDQIQELKNEGYIEVELDLHIEKLHQYNEIKDATQLILGKLANIQGKTLKEIHEEYDLDLKE